MSRNQTSYAQKWSQDELLEAERRHQDGEHWAEIATAIGRDYKGAGEHLRKAVRRRVRKAGLSAPSTAPDATTSVEDRTITAAALAMKERDDDRADAFRLNDAARLELLIRTTQNAALRTPRPVNLKVAPKRDRSDRDAATLMSDLQLGQKTLAEDMGGLGEYNLDIFEKRLASYQDQLVEWCDLYKPKTLYIFALGDWVDGNSIYASQPWALSMGAVDQVLYTADVIPGFLANLLQVVPEIRMECVGGNHGRLGHGGKKSEFLYRENMDRLAYHHLKARTAQFPEIKWNIPATWWNWTEIRGKGYFQVHGDDIPNLGNLLERADLRYSRLYQANDVVKRIDYLLLGHHHNYLNTDTRGGEAYANGSFPGISEFSAKRLIAANHAAQVFFTIDRDGEIEARHKFVLDKGERVSA